MTTENKRDLAADLALCESVPTVYYDEGGGYTAESLSEEATKFFENVAVGWPEAIRRAIAAEAEVEELRRENVRLQAQIDYVKYTCGELAETYRIYAEEGADRGSSLERVYSGMSIAYEDAVDMFEPEVPANE